MPLLFLATFLNAIIKYMVFKKVYVYILEVRKILMFLSLLCSPRLHLFDQKYSKNSNIVKNYYNLKKNFLIV